MVIGFLLPAILFALLASALTQLFMGYRGRLRATAFALAVTFLVVTFLALLLDGLPRTSSRFFEMLTLTVPLTLVTNTLILIPILLAKLFSLLSKK